MLIDRGINLIGDSHLGKEFKTGVAIHRRGEREAQLFEALRLELAISCNSSIMVGDLFDGPHVSKAVVARAIDMYRARATLTPTRQFFVLAGNHDRSRQPGTVSAFDLFQRGVAGVPNITVVTELTYVEAIDTLLCPWQWGVTALDQLVDAQPASLAIGHWDLQSFGGNDDHLCPTKRLEELGVKEIWGGHYHLAGDYEVDGHTVHCTGSMLPLTHAEDSTGETYVTLTLDELEAADPASLYHKAVRVIAKRGSIIPDIDCLALTVKWEAEEETVDFQLITGSFELASSLARSFDTHGVPEFVRDFIQERM